ncbi:MAG: hypothetical protein M9962_10585 [Oligoflexia bacterium]|nr:hypothetical protein [Oligoflexia bacterium]
MNKYLLIITLKITLIFTQSIAYAKNEKKWTEWYLYTINGNFQGYFEESLELRTDKNQLAISQNWVEQSDGIAKTFIGSVADNKALKPVAFFSNREGKTSYKIEGIEKSGTLSMTFHKDSAESKEKKSIKISDDLVLSNFIPIYLARLVGQKEEIQFKALVEDAQDGNFDMRSATAKINGKTKTIKKENCRQFELNIDGISQEWWIAKNGKLCEVFIPSGNSRLVLSSEKEVKEYKKK